MRNQLKSPRTDGSARPVDKQPDEDQPDYAEIGRRGAALARTMLRIRGIPIRDQPYLPADLLDASAARLKADEHRTQPEEPPE